jgi:hypothetical protein
MANEQALTVAQACRDNLRAMVREFRKKTGLSTSQVSKRYYGNAGFLDAFLAGKQSMSLNKFDHVVASIAKDWPDDAEWPSMRAVVPRRPGKKSFPQ